MAEVSCLSNKDRASFGALLRRSKATYRIAPER
jgi:hypothetical protein